jgi:hypothetical protein
METIETLFGVVSERHVGVVDLGRGRLTYNQPRDRIMTSAIFWLRTIWRRHIARTGRAAIIRSVTVFKVPRPYSALAKHQHMFVTLGGP